MIYENQLDMIENYIRNGEKKRENFKIGVEMEHFVIWEDSLKTVSYYGKDGVEDSLKELESKGWVGSYEKEYLLGLKKDNLTITLEPGSQFELSIDSAKDIEELEKAYLIFLREISLVLKKKKQKIVSLGYHPATKIDEIKLLPKERYGLMFEYFKSKGSHAHNMMKGTGAFQIAIDYSDEADYTKKFRSLNALAPTFYAIFENAFFFEGEPYYKHNLRAYVWLNTDKDRQGTVEGALNKSFTYRDYAKYILERPPVFTIREGQVIPTGNKKVKDFLDPETTKKTELEHLLTMFFPDVRTKNFIEIRMMDSIPYPLNFAAVALIKGIFYNDENLDEIYKATKNITYQEVHRTKLEMLEKGFDATIDGRKLLDKAIWLMDLAREGLCEDEKKYLIPLESLLKNKENPYIYTKKRYEENKNRAYAIDWAIYK